MSLHYGLGSPNSYKEINQDKKPNWRIELFPRNCMQQLKESRKWALSSKQVRNSKVKPTEHMSLPENLLTNIAAPKKLNVQNIDQWLTICSNLLSMFLTSLTPKNQSFSIRSFLSQLTAGSFEGRKGQCRGDVWQQIERTETKWTPEII